MRPHAIVQPVKPPRGTIRVGVLRDHDPSVPLLPMAAALLHGSGHADVALPDARIYGEWLRRIGEGSIVLVPESAADVFLCAHDACDQSRVACGLVAARRSGAPVVLYSESDDVKATPTVGGTVFRSSAYASRLRPHERIATGWVPDLRAESSDGCPEVAPWHDRPTVGFIGHVTGGLRSIRYITRGMQHFYGFRYRDQVLRTFERSSDVSTAFVRRRRNLGPPMAGTHGDERRRAMRREYVESVFANPYSLCIRGAGNWSYRLFETLAAGRIPVLIDTDCALPMEREIEWTKHIIRIPSWNLAHAPRMLAEFHCSLGPDGVRRMQLRNRDLWIGTLQPAEFFERSLRDVAEGNLSGPNSSTWLPAGRP